jgi:hypothetical protein
VKLHRRLSLLHSWAFGFALTIISGCGAQSDPLLRTATDLPEQRRHPDGVAVDPSSAPPAAKDTATTSDGLVTLRTPVGLDTALASIQTFFEAVLAEDPDVLGSVLTRDAMVTNPTLAAQGPMGSPNAALFWAHRFRRLDYTKLAGEAIYHENDLEVYRAGDDVNLSPHPSVRVEALNAGDVVIRVPIVTPRAGTDRLFGDEIVVWLRRTGNEYKIYRLLEEFQVQ